MLMRPKQLIIQASGAIGRGGLVIFPTETVYALAAAADDATAKDEMFKIKGRNHSKPMQLLASSLNDALPYIDRRTLTPALRRLLRRLWPGPLTSVLKASALGRQLSNAPTIGVRIPDHPIARAILKACGPLAATSANRSGGPEPVRPGLVPDALRKKAKCVIMERGKTRRAGPSTVVDFTQKPPKVLRQGALPYERIAKTLNA